jgi:hypothetical protein
MAAGIKATLGLDVVVRTSFKDYIKTMYVQLYSFNRR